MFVPVLSGRAKSALESQESCWLWATPVFSCGFNGLARVAASKESRLNMNFATAETFYPIICVKWPSAVSYTSHHYLLMENTSLPLLSFDVVRQFPSITFFFLSAFKLSCNNALILDINVAGNRYKHRTNVTKKITASESALGGDEVQHFHLFTAIISNANETIIYCGSAQSCVANLSSPLSSARWIEKNSPQG